LIYLHKILPILVLPTGMALFLLGLGLLFNRKKTIVAALIIVWVSSIPALSDALMHTVESPYQRLSVHDAQRTDAIVVLSGGRVVAPGLAGVSEWGDADRFFAGVELFKAGKAPWLVFTGGWVPWEPDAQPEGVVLKAYAQELGVPSSAIVVSDNAQNTAEEALAVKSVLDSKFNHLDRIKITLVTSAFHMQRAKRLFESAGFDVTEFPVDFQVSAAQKFTVLDLLPQAQAMQQTEMAVREIYGRAFYTLLGH
jgi:uncharacterized SAM-binding protein YcdF (DUF218 family)